MLLERLQFRKGARVLYGDGGRVLYDFYKFGGKKLGVTGKDIEKAYGDALTYTEDWYKNKYNEPFLPTDWSTKQGKEVDNASEIFTHVLSAYRFGDSKVKRAAVQAKDLSQAVTHLSKDEFGDYLNNKVGFTLRDKYPDSEKDAMNELAQLINTRDKKLYFKNKNNEERIQRKKGGKAKSTVNKAGNYTKPGLRKRIFQRIKSQASHGTAAGKWSARKAQALDKAYKKAGGGYK